MTRFVAAVVAAVALFGASLTRVQAQYLPPGSYQASCQNMSMNGPVLSARCTGPHGRYHYSQINVRQCPTGSVRNLNGFLACGVGAPANGGYPGGNGFLPNGSYRMSCTNAFVQGRRLTATCPAPNGNRITTSIFFQSCNGGDLQNRNGALACVFP